MGALFYNIKVFGGVDMGDIKEDISIKEKLEKFIYSPEYSPMKLKDIYFLLGVPSDKKAEVEQSLTELVNEGKIMISKKGKYKPLETELIEGTFIGNKKGFGFVAVEGEQEDYFVPARDSLDAFHGDRVLIEPREASRSGKSHEAKVVKILERGFTKIVGTFDKQKGFGFLIPDNRKIADDIFIQGEDSMGAMTGHKCVCELTSYGSKGKSPEGKIIEIIGHVNDPKTDIISVVRAYDIPVEFPDEVMKSLNDIPEEVSPEELEGREDMRDWLTITIDGEDAKDLDDAVTLTVEDGVYTLGVHIADVTHYVKEKSPLDKEALKRGTSCYLVDSVIPMLPHKLSNGICSLNHDVDRLTLSCIMRFDSTGKLLDHRIVEGVINVNNRMNYTDVNKLLNKTDDAPVMQYMHLMDMLEHMKELSRILREKREKRGSIDFDVPETKIIVDKDGKPVEIKPYDRNTATMLIEDFMLAANETIAEDYFWQELPFEYRVHEQPDIEKMDNLRIFLNNFGVFTKPSRDEIHPKELQKILKAIKGESYEALISKIMLRSMKQARYSTVCSGHFGLSCKYYCHFTSPIRRYPDLQIHRIIKENINGRLDEKRINHYHTILGQVRDDNSLKERRAEEAEREVVKLKEIEYMSEHIGEEFDGVVSGVTSNFVFVELENTVEGAASVADMFDDLYFFKEEEYAMVGEKTGKRYTLGDKVRVKVLKCDKIQKSIDFSIISGNID